LPLGDGWLLALFVSFQVSVFQHLLLPPSKVAPPKYFNLKDTAMSDLFGDSSSDDEDNNGNNEERSFNSRLQQLKANDPRSVGYFGGGGQHRCIQNVTDEKWEEIGNDIANNTHLTVLLFYEGALNDHKMTFLFRGLTGSNSLRRLELNNNALSVVGMRSMVPFLQNSNNLVKLDLDDNNLQSEGFNAMFRGLRNSPIEQLYCNKCGITSIEIRCIPKHLKRLDLNENSISVDGCRQIAKLLGGDATLEQLQLRDNEIDDEGVEILVEALKNNKSLKQLYLRENDSISRQGRIMLLKLVSDISSIEATLRSNHTLEDIKVLDEEEEDEILEHIDHATYINRHADAPRLFGGIGGPADTEKVILMQLQSALKAKLAELQGVYQSIYSEIDPLHLPEVLSKICRRYGMTELYAALKSSLLELISTVNRKACILLKRDSYLAKVAQLNAEAAQLNTKVAQLNAELAVIEAAEGGEMNDGSEECPNSKRRRQA
jgi:hypothetical protein